MALYQVLYQVLIEWDTILIYLLKVLTKWDTMLLLKSIIHQLGHYIDAYK